MLSWFFLWDSWHIFDYWWWFFMLRLIKNDRGRFLFLSCVFWCLFVISFVQFSSSNSYHMVLGFGLWFCDDYLLMDSFNFSGFNFLLFWFIILNLVKIQFLWYLSLLLNLILDYNFVIFPFFFSLPFVKFDSWLQLCDIPILLFVKLDSWYQLCDILPFCLIWFLITILWYFHFLVEFDSWLAFCDILQLCLV